MAISSRFRHIDPYLDERTRRVLAAAEAMAAGRGGISQVSRSTGIPRDAIRSGLKELSGNADRIPADAGRVCRPGGGIKWPDAKDPNLFPARERLVAPATRGDPMSPLRWTSNSTKKLAGQLTRQRHPASARTVARLLGVLGYSPQANLKSMEGRSENPDCNAQFEFINQQAKDRLACWRTGHLGVGTDHDTATFRKHHDQDRTQGPCRFGLRQLSNRSLYLKEGNA